MKRMGDAARRSASRHVCSIRDPPTFQHPQPGPHVGLSGASPVPLQPRAVGGVDAHEIGGPPRQIQVDDVHPVVALAGLEVQLRVRGGQGGQRGPCGEGENEGGWHGWDRWEDAVHGQRSRRRQRRDAASRRSGLRDCSTARDAQQHAQQRQCQRTRVLLVMGAPT